MTLSTRIAEFDLWRPGYGGASVEVLVAGTTTPASIYSDTDLSVALSNPQTLQSRQEVDGTVYGRFAQAVYVGVPYTLRINTGEQTGIERPAMTTLAGENASTATVTSTRGSASRTLAAHLDVEVRTQNFGTFGVSASANTTILDAAIGAAAAQGGGRVLLPSGTITITQTSLPQDVILVGQARGATTLRSEQAQEIITLDGDGAGLANLTLDGVNLNVGSIGVLGIGKARVVLENVIIKRFAQGILMRGGESHRYRECYVQNCTKGVDLRGDRDALDTNTGGPFTDMQWDGGSVETCSTEGLRLSFEDDPVTRSTIKGVLFDSNSADAVIINGARVTTFEACRWTGNTGNLDVTDDGDLSRADENTIQQILVWNCSFDTGTLSFNGLCEDVRFEGCDFTDVDWVLSVPLLPILLLDCTEDADSTASGALDRLMRNDSFKRGEFPGVTTDASWTTAWQTELVPGDIIRVKARVLGRQRNGGDLYSGELTATYIRAASELQYTSASATPVAGTVVTGGTSGAEARVLIVTGTTSGTLSLRDITGSFTNGEALTFSDAKTATAASTLVNASASLDPAHWAIGDLEVESDATWDIRASVTGSSALVQVKGASSATVEWLVEVDVLRP